MEKRGRMGKSATEIPSVRAIARRGPPLLPHAHTRTTRPLPSRRAPHLSPDEMSSAPCRCVPRCITARPGTCLYVCTCRRWSWGTGRGGEQTSGAESRNRRGKGSQDGRPCSDRERCGWAPAATEQLHRGATQHPARGCSRGRASGGWGRVRGCGGKAVGSVAGSQSRVRMCSAHRVSEDSAEGERGACELSAEAHVERHVAVVVVPAGERGGENEEMAGVNGEV